MLHYVFAIIVLMHGVIHLLGYTHELKLAQRDNISSNELLNLEGEESVIKVLWLLPYLLFLASTILFMLYLSSWWMVATAGVLLSQILIILDWREAKYGTLANIIIMLVVVAAYGSWSF